jgi:hypothetical protein
MEAASSGLKYAPAVGKGRGVFAAKAFAPGDTVVMGQAVGIKPERTIYSIQKDWNLHVELDEPARSLNHSCNPNTGVVDNSYGAYDFVATTSILLGEEITFDYETTEYEIIFAGQCLCTTAECRGRAMGFKYRTDRPGFLARYLGTSMTP